MEDALALINSYILESSLQVLILVVMEDALARVDFNTMRFRFKCLNPCCNGRCTRTSFLRSLRELSLICLNPCCNGRCTRTSKEQFKNEGYKLS